MQELQKTSPTKKYDLRSNSITEVDAKSFEDLTMLEELYLDENRYIGDKFDKTAFQPLRSIRYLSMADIG